MATGAAKKRGDDYEEGPLQPFLSGARQPGSGTAHQLRDDPRGQSMRSERPLDPEGEERGHRV